MTLRIFLIRHAEHAELGRTLTGRRTDVRLSEAGERQADATGAKLSGMGVGRIFSSPRERALQTARTIAQHCDAEVEIAAELDEIDFGAWSGRRFEELACDPLWRRWNEERGGCRAPGGETMSEAACRAVALVERLAGEAAAKDAALVTHCDIIRGIVAHYLGVPLDNLLRFDVDPASITTLTAGGWGAQIHSLNERMTA